MHCSNCGHFRRVRSLKTTEALCLASLKDLDKGINDGSQVVTTQTLDITDYCLHYWVHLSASFSNTYNARSPVSVTYRFTSVRSGR